MRAWTETQLCVQESPRNCPKLPAALSVVRRGLAPEPGAADWLKAPDKRLESCVTEAGRPSSSVLIRRRLRGRIELESAVWGRAAGRKADEDSRDVDDAGVLRSVMMTADSTAEAARASFEGFASVLGGAAREDAGVLRADDALPAPRDQGGWVGCDMLGSWVTSVRLAARRQAMGSSRLRLSRGDLVGICKLRDARGERSGSASCLGAGKTRCGIRHGKTARTMKRNVVRPN